MGQAGTRLVKDHNSSNSMDVRINPNGSCPTLCKSENSILATPPRIELDGKTEGRVSSRLRKLPRKMKDRMKAFRKRWDDRKKFGAKHIIEEDRQPFHSDQNKEENRGDASSDSISPSSEKASVHSSTEIESSCVVEDSTMVNTSVSAFASGDSAPKIGVVWPLNYAQLYRPSQRLTAKQLGYTTAIDGSVIYTMFVREMNWTFRSIQRLLSERLISSLQRRYDCSLHFGDVNCFYRGSQVRVLTVRGPSKSNICKLRSALPTKLSRNLVMGMPHSADVDTVLET